MTLPDETAVADGIARDHRRELDAMTGLHDAVMKMLLMDQWTVPTGDLDSTAVRTIAGLLTKAAKTFRAIQLLCERGLVDDAHALARVLFETTVAIHFILEVQPEERARMYHAHAAVQTLKMVTRWKATPGLERFATDAALQQADDAFEVWMKQLPVGVNVRKHWSGTTSLEHALKSLPGGQQWYELFYRFSSTSAHATDFGAHVTADLAFDDVVFQVAPSEDGLEMVGGTARELFWLAASRIDERFELGFGSTLAAHRVQVPGATP